MKGYKWLTNRMRSSHGNITWKLNEWQIHKGELKLCQSGFHASKTAFDSLQYIYGDKLVEVEAEDIIGDNDKFVSSKMRVVKELPTKKIMLKFAIECAKRVLPILEKKYPNDNRPRNAIEIAENILIGATYSSTDVAYATANAAWLTTDILAYAAACVARSAAYTARSAACAVKSVVWLTADAAARSAEYAVDAIAYTTEPTAERKWQSEKLQEIIEEYTSNK